MANADRMAVPFGSNLGEEILGLGAARFIWRMGPKFEHVKLFPSHGSLSFRCRQIEVLGPNLIEPRSCLKQCTLVSLMLRHLLKLTQFFARQILSP
jgi:hypothetical protein